MMEMGWLTSLVLFMPLIGMTTVMIFSKTDSEIKWTTLGFTVLTFLLSLAMWASFDGAEAGLQMVQRWDWLDIQVGDFSISSDYYVGVDGLSILLVVLTTFIMPIATLISFEAGVLKERGRQKLYYCLLLLLEWAMLGVFFIQDLIVFYVFWEVTLVPMYFLIGIWGSDERVYAAVKFFLYTMAGSILMLIAILFVGNAAGAALGTDEGFSVPAIIQLVQENPNFWNSIEGPASAGAMTGGLLFFGFFIAFAIKVPVFPFHSWLPDAHVQAPTAGSVVLAGVLLKMGTYGMVRFNLQMFPVESVQFAPIIATLGVIGILYGAWVSYAQDNVKKLVAYSSISHLGFVIVGIFALNSQGLQGATLQMVNHGISTGGLFLMVGILYERWHTKEMAAYGGIWKLMPLFGGISLVIALSSMGLPGLNGFIGEFTILLGSIGSEYLGFFFTLFATMGVILAATYILKMYQHVYMGDAKDAPHADENTYKLHWTELTALVAILIPTFWIGLQPGGFFDSMSGSAQQLAAHIDDSYEAFIAGDAELVDEAEAETSPDAPAEDAAVDDEAAESDAEDEAPAETPEDGEAEAGTDDGDAEAETDETTEDGEAEAETEAESTD